MKALFTNPSTGEKVSFLYQWETDIDFSFEAKNGTNVEVAFSTMGMKEAIRKDCANTSGDTWTCKVPDTILQYGTNIAAHITYISGNSVRVVDRADITVKKRKKPAGYVSTTDDTWITVEQMLERIEASTNNIEAVEKNVKSSETEVKKVKEEVDGKINDFSTEFENYVRDFELLHQQAVADVNNAGQAQAERVEGAGDQAVKDINAAGTAQINAINAAGSEQKKAVEDAGQEALNNIGNGVDSSLTVSGKAADARETGAAIDELKGEKVDKDGIKQITRRNTEFFVEGKNLFNKNAVEDGFISSANGLLYEHATYKASEYIAVNAGDTLYIRGAFTGHNAFYNKNKQYVCGVDFGEKYSVVVPENVSFIRVTSYASELDTCMISVTPADFYVPYEAPKIPSYEVEGLVNLEESVRGLDESVDAVIVKNMLNPDTFTEGTYISAEGAFIESTVYSVSDYIPIRKGETLTLYNELLSEQNMRMFAAFNSNKQIIDKLGSNTPVSSITQSGDMAFVRVSIQTDYVGTLMFMSVKPDRFIPYGEIIVNPSAVSIPDEVVIDAYIPDELWVAQGRTIEIYNRQVCLQYDKFHIRWIGKIGSARKRKVTINGNVAIGDYYLTLEIYDDKKRKQYSKTMTVHIVNNALTGEYAICPIGDSLTNNKKWLAEVINLSNEKISYVGTYNFSIADADGNTRTGGHEGRSGFSAESYIKGVPYTFGSAKEEESKHNLFWDSENNRFNWAKYKATHNISANAVQIYLGTNGLQADNTDNVGYIKQLVDYIIQDEGANFPIFVVNTINKATQDGLGANVTADGYAGLSGMWDYEERSKIMDLTRRLDDAFKEYTNVHMVNLAITHDDEYNFGAQETPVNPRANQMEYLPTDGVHPQAQGYYQMADVMYSVYCAFLD